ncbi:hypothetical protein D3C87_364080 [compost metagenome]
MLKLKRGTIPVGFVYGRLTVLSKDPSTDKPIKWVCECSCGIIKSYNPSNIRRGMTKSCGCLQKETVSERTLINRAGERYGRLLVLVRAGFRRESAVWLCRCDCGNQVEVAAPELSNGDTQSCGCLQKERTVQTKITHGKSDSKEYSSWRAMKSRCTNENRDNFKRYGGRGITICERWFNSFENFLEDMGPAPSPDHSIERDDVDLNYEPGNCRWATQQEQMRNTSRSRRVSWNGSEMTLVELSEVTGVKYDLLQARLNRDWSVEDAVNKPKGFRL